MKKKDTKMKWLPAIFSLLGLLYYLYEEYICHKENAKNSKVFQSNVDSLKRMLNVLQPTEPRDDEGVGTYLDETFRSQIKNAIAENDKAIKL